jgi:hypothetical protein
VAVIAGNNFRSTVEALFETVTDVAERRHLAPTSTHCARSRQTVALAVRPHEVLYCLQQKHLHVLWHLLYSEEFPDENKQGSSHAQRSIPDTFQSVTTAASRPAYTLYGTAKYFIFTSINVYLFVQIL